MRAHPRSDTVCGMVWKTMPSRAKAKTICVYTMLTATSDFSACNDRVMRNCCGIQSQYIILLAREGKDKTMNLEQVATHHQEATEATEEEQRPFPDVARCLEAQSRQDYQCDAADHGAHGGKVIDDREGVFGFSNSRHA